MACADFETVFWRQATAPQPPATPAWLQDVSSDDEADPEDAPPPAQAPQGSISAPAHTAAVTAETSGTVGDESPSAGDAVADWTPEDLTEAVRRVAEYGSKAVARAGSAAGPARGGPAPSPRAASPSAWPAAAAALPPPSPRLPGTTTAAGGAGASRFPRASSSADQQTRLARLDLSDVAPRLAAVSADSALRHFPGPPHHQQQQHHPLPPLSAASLSSRDLPPPAPGFQRTESGRLMASDPVLAVPPGRTFPRSMTVLEAAQRRAAAVRTSPSLQHLLSLDTDFRRPPCFSFLCRRIWPRLND